LAPAGERRRRERVVMIFLNPAGAPELACDACGSRWFDRMTDTCYECGAAVGAGEIWRFQEALRSFQAEKPGFNSPHHTDCLSTEYKRRTELERGE
jgi:hypothetical protein